MAVASPGALMQPSSSEWPNSSMGRVSEESYYSKVRNEVMGGATCWRDAGHIWGGLHAVAEAASV